MYKKMISKPKQTHKTAHMSVLITVHNCLTQQSTELFRLFSSLQKITISLMPSITGEGDPLSIFW